MKNERAARYVVESTWTAEEALAWAREQYAAKGRWPSRRFRVDGAMGGSSRLLGPLAAARTRRTYGGWLVELIPRKAARK